MKNRTVSLWLCVLLISSSTTAIAATPVKQNAKCSKLNQKVNSRQVKFQCVKSGKKLVWKKISPTSVVAPGEKSSTPEPIPSPSQSLSYEQIQLEGYIKCLNINGYTNVKTEEDVKKLGSIDDFSSPGKFCKEYRPKFLDLPPMYPEAFGSVTSSNEVKMLIKNDNASNVLSWSSRLSCGKNLSIKWGLTSKPLSSEFEKFPSNIVRPLDSVEWVNPSQVTKLIPDVENQGFKFSDSGKYATCIVSRLFNGVYVYIGIASVPIP